MPEAVIADLKDNDDHPILNANVVADSRSLIQHVWQSTANE